MLMKKIMTLLLVCMIFSVSGVLAERCNLQASMINQDPYPALQGDYVKVVFQLDGVANTECGKVEFELVENYPISFDLPELSKVTVDSGTYQKDFSSFLIAPFKVRVDENALDGDNPIEVKYRHSGNEAYETKQFDLNVEDTRADFEIHVENYDAITKTITFEILHIGKSDIEALSVEIPKQDSVNVKGSNINIVGDLDSNEYTTADFEAVAEDGEISVKLTYTDSINERRSVAKDVYFDSEYFQGRASEQKKSNTSTYVILVIVALVVGYFFYRRWKKKKAREEHKKKH